MCKVGNLVNEGRVGVNTLFACLNTVIKALSFCFIFSPKFETNSTRASFVKLLKSIQRSKIAVATVESNHNSSNRSSSNNRGCSSSNSSKQANITATITTTATTTQQQTSAANTTITNQLWTSQSSTRCKQNERKQSAVKK